MASPAENEAVVRLTEWLDEPILGRYERPYANPSELKADIRVLLAALRAQAEAGERLRYERDEALDTAKFHAEKRQAAEKLLDEKLSVESADRWLAHRFNETYDRAEAAEARLARIIEYRPCLRFDITPCDQRAEFEEVEWCPLCVARAALTGEGT